MTKQFAVHSVLRLEMGMTVYVDDMRRDATVNGMWRRWSHLFADDSRELRRFASRLGLASAWVQAADSPEEHFDVTDNIRVRALALGAVAVSYLEVPRILRGIHAQHRGVGLTRAAAEPMHPSSRTNRQRAGTHTGMVLF